MMTFASFLVGGRRWHDMVDVIEHVVDPVVCRCFCPGKCVQRVDDSGCLFEVSRSS